MVDRKARGRRDGRKMDKLIQVWVTPEMKDKVEEVAASRGYRTVADYVRASLGLQA